MIPLVVIKCRHRPNTPFFFTRYIFKRMNVICITNVKVFIQIMNSPGGVRLPIVAYTGRPPSSISDYLTIIPRARMGSDSIAHQAPSLSPHFTIRYYFIFPQKCKSVLFTFTWLNLRSTQREYSSKPFKHSIVKRILVFKRQIQGYFYPLKIFHLFGFPS